MNWAKRWGVLILLVAGGVCGHAATARIVKVLPQWLDLQGRASVSPSLYERDAYQAYLREHPDQRSGIRYVVQWRCHGVEPKEVRLRVELRTSAGHALEPVVFEQKAAPHGWFSHWSTLKIRGAAYRKLGTIIAWRVTLWKGNQQLAEKKSFLW